MHDEIDFLRIALVVSGLSVVLCKLKKEGVSMRVRASRSIALDVVRCFALFSVFGVHFFLNNGFYQQTVAGGRMFVMTVMRSGFMVCVPLFILLTGYLMCNKKLSRGYYTRIIRILCIYILASGFCIVYKLLVQKNGQSILGAVSDVFSYRAAPYSWYIEMYIGLFLLIPFLNIIWHGLESKRQKQWLVVTFAILTIVPGALNIFRFSDLSWWVQPSSNSTYFQLVPQWWQNVYPVTYYFLGAYLREYPLRLKPVHNLLLLLSAVLGFGAFSYYRSYGSVFLWGVWQNWGSLLITVETVLVFVFLLERNYDWMPAGLQKLIGKVSEWSLGAFMVSWVFDNLFYAKLNSMVPVPTERLEWFVVVVPLVFVGSVVTAAILELIYSLTVGRLLEKKN